MLRLDHVNIQARDQEQMRDFLVSVLGLIVGERPPFPFPGYWLYAGAHPVVHLQARQGPETVQTGGCFDHVAFGVYDDYESLLSRLQACGYPFENAGIPGTGIGQFFVTGPEGVRIELQYNRARTPQPLI